MNTLGLAAYIKRHWEPSRLWDRARLVPWVDWYVDDGRVATVATGGRTVGLGMMRTLKGRDDYEEVYAHDENGTVAWIDLYIARDKQVAPLLWKAMRDRVGQRCKEIGFVRHAKGRMEPRFYELNQMERVMSHGK